MDTKKARLDADRTAKPLTRLVKHAPIGQCVSPNMASHGDTLEYEDESGSRTPLVPKMTEEQVEDYERWARRMERC